MFSHIDERTFQRFYGSGLNLHSYLPQPQLLIAKMENQAHAQANGAFVAEMVVKLTEMGMSISETLEIMSGGVTKGRDKYKNPDHKFFPTSLPEGRDPKWPSMVIEVGHTESAARLRRDAGWWINASDGDVKLALTILIPKKKGMITYGLWGLTDRSPRPGKEITAQLRHEVTITRRPDSSIVASDNLTIPFEHLFLRTPQGTETDIVIDKGTLQRLAGKTWEEMDKSERERKCLCPSA